MASSACLPISHSEMLKNLWFLAQQNRRFCVLEIPGISLHTKILRIFRDSEHAEKFAKRISGTQEMLRISKCDQRPLVLVMDDEAFGSFHRSLTGGF